MTKKIKPIEKIRRTIDSLAEIGAEIKELTSQKEDLNTLLKKYITSKDLGDDTDALILGEAYEVEVGVAGSKREISDMPKIKKILGDKAFMGLVTIKMKDVDQYLSAEQQEEVLTTERTQTRVFKFKLVQPKSNLKKKKSKAK